MKPKEGARRGSLTSALEAIDNLAAGELGELFNGGQITAMLAHNEIGLASISLKTGVFYRHLVPSRNDLVSALAKTYRRYFKLALAHPQATGNDPDNWARQAIEPATTATLEWLRNWYILACDGAAPPLPSQRSWRAPAWLFQISFALVGVGPLKEKHVPVTHSEEKLSAAHTHLLLRGARRSFLSQLNVTVEIVRNEEVAAAGAIPVVGGQTRGPNKRKGFEQREKLYQAIRKILKVDPTLQGMDLCAELDKRHARPLYDWTKRGEWRDGLTWKEAWGIPGLRRKIRRVRQEAMKRS